MRAPLFRALDALAVDDRGGRACFARGGFPALDGERLVDALERAVPTPKVEVIVEGRARRQILRDGAPLAAGAENVHEAVDNLAYVDVALVAAAFGRRNQRYDMPPLGVGQIARIAQPTAVIASAVFVGPHWRPLRRFGPPLLNHKQFQQFVKFSDRLSKPLKSRGFCRNSGSVFASELPKIRVDETVDRGSIGNRDQKRGREEDEGLRSDNGNVFGNQSNCHIVY